MPVVSRIGRASMSARRPITRPLAAVRPRMTPTTPVRPMPVDHLVDAELRASLSATVAAVRCTS